MSKLICRLLLIASLILLKITHSAETQLRIRARRCICISISCGCYQPSRLVQQQPLPSSNRQPIYRQQPDTVPCITNCLHNCMQNQQNACQQSCQSSCSTQPTYRQPNSFALSPSYQYEPMSHEVATGQRSSSNTCIHVCMPSCESQCIQRFTPAPFLQQPNSAIPVVQNQTPSYYPSVQSEPAVQENPNNINTMCIHLCMPSCESQCIERTTPAIPSYTGQTEQPNGVYYPKPVTYSPSSYQNFVPANQTSRSSGTATICLPTCMPSCQTKCTENQEQNGTQGENANNGNNQESATPNQIDFINPQEISISLPQSIQQSPDCMNLCHETCTQQCVAQNQPADQCGQSCMYTCQESCPQPHSNIVTTVPVQQPQTESEIYETVVPASDNSINFPLFKAFLLRSPPYYQRSQFNRSQVVNCLPGSAQRKARGTGQCNCPSGYATCFSTNSRIAQQQCCRRKR